MRRNPFLIVVAVVAIAVVAWLAIGFTAAATR